MPAELIWITPEADKQTAWMARVSNAKATPDDPSEKLIAYLLRHKHYSPFEMANMCVRIETTRDIARQILRHRSFHFQELSQRYAEISHDLVLSDARLQDTKNRQNSIEVYDPELQEYWHTTQDWVYNIAHAAYRTALEEGIAKEVARKLLPEGLTATTLYMSGTVRDWLHYIAIRTDPGTQKEHRDVALAILEILEEACPVIVNAARGVALIAN